MTELSPGRRRWDTAFAGVLVVLFAYAAYAALAYPENARLFPLAVAFPGLALAILQLALSFRPREAESRAVATTDEESDPLSPAERTRRTLAIAGWIVGFFAAIYLLGFPLAVPLGAIAYMRLAAKESWPASTIVAGLCWVLVFGVFDRVLHLPMPPGPLLRLIGIS